MGEPAGGADPRSLTRSLEPLTGESLAGYLLRLSYRLRITPLQLARLTGCTSGTSTQIGRRLLLDLDIHNFARTTRLTPAEAAALTLVPWADRYPPIARSRSGSSPPAALDDWLFNNSLRYCPGCLAGDGSPIQQRYGGPWKKIWHLPISFACPEHHMFLKEGCPRPHPPDPGIWRLITHTSGSTLHPAQCRRPEHPGRLGRHRPSCGARLDLSTGEERLRPSPSMLKTQQRLLGLFDLQRHAEDAVRCFTDVRVATALLYASWPLGQDLTDLHMAAIIAEHVHQLGAGTRRAHDRPPQGIITTAGLLTAATAVLDSPDVQSALARHLQASWPGRPSSSPFAQVLARHESSCSKALREAVEPATRAYRRRTGSHSPKAPARTGGYRPEHIPAFLEHGWYQQHLAPLEYRHAAKILRRAGAATLVQWAAGGSLGDAATFLGINPKGGQYAFTRNFYRWLDGHGQARFTAALKDLAADLDTEPGPLDYQHRRHALRNWCLSEDTWDEIITLLPPVPGPVQPTLDDRKRQEASAFVWARVTQGEPLFAPRPIEADQPAHVRKAWLHRRSNTWSQLSRPDPLAHYAALRKLLTQHADQLATRIDNSATTASVTGSLPM